MKGSRPSKERLWFCCLVLRGIYMQFLDFPPLLVKHKNCYRACHVVTLRWLGVVTLFPLSLLAQAERFRKFMKIFDVFGRPQIILHLLKALIYQQCLKFCGSMGFLWLGSHTTSERIFEIDHQKLQNSEECMM